MAWRGSTNERELRRISQSHRRSELKDAISTIWGGTLQILGLTFHSSDVCRYCVTAATDAITRQAYRPFGDHAAYARA